MMRTVLILLVGLLISGCQAPAGGPNRTPPPNSQTVPPANHVRIIPEMVRSDAREVNWSWTVIGDRNWKLASGGGTSFTLSDSFPFNDASRGGTHVWELWISAKSVGTAPKGVIVEYEAQLRGSNGASVKTGVRRVETHSPTLAAAVLIEQGLKSTPSLPTTVKLASVGTEYITLEVKP